MLVAAEHIGNFQDMGQGLNTFGIDAFQSAHMRQYVIDLVRVKAALLIVKVSFAKPAILLISVVVTVGFVDIFGPVQ